MYIFSTQKIFSAVSAGSSEFVAALLDRQFHNSADFADLSAASLDSTIVWQRNSMAFLYSHALGLSLSSVT